MIDYDIEGGLRKLDKLSLLEYHEAAVKVVGNPDRLRRLSGIMIKEPFGTAHPIKNHPTATGAQRYWTWDSYKFANRNAPQLPEFHMLNELSQYQGHGTGLSGLEVLAVETETERGLFKITAEWLKDKLAGRDAQSLRKYYGAAESKKAATLLDLADLLANFALTPVYVALLPAGGFIIPILLLAAKHGYKAVFESDAAPDGRS